VSRNSTIAFALLGGAGLLYLLSKTNTATQVAQSVEDTVQAALSGWQTVQQGPVWVPYINGTEIVIDGGTIPTV